MTGWVHALTTECCFTKNYGLSWVHWHKTFSVSAFKKTLRLLKPLNTYNCLLHWQCCFGLKECGRRQTFFCSCGLTRERLLVDREQIVKINGWGVWDIIIQIPGVRMIPGSRLLPYILLLTQHNLDRRKKRLCDSVWLLTPGDHVLRLTSNVA